MPVTAVIILAHGLAMFSLGVAGLHEVRRRSGLLLGRQLPWLAAFALAESALQWLALLQLNYALGETPVWMEWLRLVLLPLGALLLIRLGIGLLSESGPLPDWLLLFPYIILVPAALILAYGLVVFLTEPAASYAGALWARYLLLIPGGTLTAWGFLRQARNEPVQHSLRVGPYMRASAVAFLAYTLVVGFVAPLEAEHFRALDEVGLGIEAVLPELHIWQTGVAVVMAYVVIRALGVFELEQAERLKATEAQRMRAEERVRQSEERLRSIFENAPIGMLILDEAEQVVQINQAVQQMLGYTEAELQQMRFGDFAHPGDRPGSQRRIQDVRDGKLDTFQMEERCIAKDGRIVEGRMTVAASRDQKGEIDYFLAMVEDVTEQNQVARVLQAERARVQEERFHAMAEARRTTANWVTSLVATSRRIAEMQSLDDILVHILGQAQCLLGVDVVSLGLFDEELRLMVRCQATAHGAHLLQPPLLMENPDLTEILRTGKRHKFPGHREAAEISWYCPTVARKVQAAGVVPLQFDGNVVGGIWIGYFDQPRLEPGQMQGLGYLADQVIIALQHATMAAQLQLAATVEERSRIAREMHDGLSQILGYLGLQVQTIESFVGQGDQERALAELSRTRANVKAAHADVRDNILRLRTTLAGQTGLIPALAEYIQGFGLQTGLDVRLIDETDGEPGLSPLAEVQLVRVIQEALTNVRKHADARHVTVRLWVEAGCFWAGVSDDGQGFPVDGPGNGSSFGLQTMRERMQAVNGRLEIRSAPGQGTDVRLCAPQLKSEGRYGQTTATLSTHR